MMQETKISGGCFVLCISKTVSKKQHNTTAVSTEKPYAWNAHGTMFQKCSTLSVTAKNAAAAKPAKSVPNVNAGINLFSQTC